MKILKQQQNEHTDTYTYIQTHSPPSLKSFTIHAENKQFVLRQKSPIEHELMFTNEDKIRGPFVEQSFLWISFNH